MINSKCHSCGSTLSYNIAGKNLKCDRCGSAEYIKSKPLTQKKNYTEQSKVEENKDGAVIYACENCGAKTNVDSSKISSTCVYCGSNNVHALKNTILFAPDGIVPFEITKEVAKEHYKSWIKKRRFVPKNLKQTAKINKMEGVYFPCWNFDFNTSSKFSGVGENTHTKTVHTGMGQNRRVHTRTYTTRHPFSGNRTDEFVDISQMASSQLAQHELDALGNYGFDKLRVYNPEYLLGFVSSTYETNLTDGLTGAKNQANKEIEQRIKNEYRYDRYASFKCQSQFFGVMWQYVYLPVWICNFKYQKKTYRFLVNGYTGHTTGKVPRSGWKIFFFVLSLLAVAGVIAYFVISNTASGPSANFEDFDNWFRAGMNLLPK